MRFSHRLIVFGLEPVEFTVISLPVVAGNDREKRNSILPLTRLSATTPSLNVYEETRRKAITLLTGPHNVRNNTAAARREWFEP